MEQQRRGNGCAVVGLVVLALIIGLIGGAGLDRLVVNLPAITGTTTGSAPSTATTSSGGLDYNLINQAYDIINKNYVDRSAIQPKNLTYGAISGLADSLGDVGHTRFMSPSDVQQQQTLNNGSFEGIGAEVDMENDHIVIVAPIDGSPAQKAGLKPGDYIMAVNGKSTEGQTLDQVVSQVLGPAGTKVTLTIYTPKTDQTRDVTITRAKIVVHSVTWNMLPGTTIAHLRISEFSNGVSNDLQQALQQIQQQHATGIILDLREDPGGLLDEAVAATSDFITKGNVLLEKDAKGNTQPVPVEKEPVTVSQPVVVLIDQGTASGAEIVAGALQDYKRGPLVGETTFGTGTVLNQFPLSDGSALLLAVEEWLTPNGRVIWHQGIKPDQEVALPANAQPLTPESEQGMSASDLQKSTDAQLQKAISILNSGK